MAWSSAVGWAGRGRVARRVVGAVAPSQRTGEAVGLGNSGWRWRVQSRSRQGETDLPAVVRVGVPVVVEKFLTLRNPLSVPRRDRRAVLGDDRGPEEPTRAIWRPLRPVWMRVRPRDLLQFTEDGAIREQFDLARPFRRQMASGALCYQISGRSPRHTSMPRGVPGRRWRRVPVVRTLPLAP
jgi:hypothetical protein